VFGGEDGADVAGLQLDFLARMLGRDGGGDDGPPVRIFVMGANRWRDEDDWPLARAQETAWYLRSDGKLARDGPGAEAPDEFVYDPNDPAPTIGGPTSLPSKMMKPNSGPLDQSRLADRTDVLVYTSDVLDRPLEVTGSIVLALHAATDAEDTDFVAKLADVHPDGRAIILVEGVVRARFREGFDTELLVEPGRPEELTISVGATSNVFRAGHRIQLLVTSSSFPRFDRNPNTGHPLGVDGPADLRVARQTIFHDAGRPSRLLLPVIAS
jgi:putative CocE/NonD family hydrolase